MLKYICNCYYNICLPKNKCLLKNRKGALIMGRRKKDNSLSETIAFKITKDQKEVLDKNKWIKEELKKQVREFLNIFVMK